MTIWGFYNGRQRKPCPEKPELLKGQRIGMYHCPYCMEMQLAGMEHISPDPYYEVITGEDWPAGYEVDMKSLNNEY